MYGIKKPPPRSLTTPCPSAKISGEKQKVATPAQRRHSTIIIYVISSCGRMEVISLPPNPFTQLQEEVIPTTGTIISMDLLMRVILCRSAPILISIHGTEPEHSTRQPVFTQTT